MSETAVAYRCRCCGQLHYPRHDRCIRCRAWEFEAVSLGQEANLLTFTQIHSLPWDDQAGPLLVGMARFAENGLTVTGQIEVDSCEQLQAGMLVSVQWRQLRTQRHDQPLYGLVLAAITHP